MRKHYCFHCSNFTFLIQTFFLPILFLSNIFRIEAEFPSLVYCNDFSFHRFPFTRGKWALITYCPLIAPLFNCYIYFTTISMKNHCLQLPYHFKKLRYQTFVELSSSEDSIVNSLMRENALEIPEIVNTLLACSLLSSGISGRSPF